MHPLSGLVVLATSAVLGLSMYLPDAPDAAQSLDEVTRISAAPDREFLLKSTPALIRSVPANAQGGDRLAAIGAASPAYAEAVAGIATKATGWTTVVTADSQSTSDARVKSSKAGDGVTRAELARDLQSELTRVGCYGGDINGAWTASTRRAMSAFLARANASLPVQEPDYILLTLVRSHQSVACTADCGRNEQMSRDGTCVPNVVVAQKEKASVAKPRVNEPRVAPAPVKYAAVAPVARQMPVTAPVSVPVPKPVTRSSWKTETIAAKQKAAPDVEVLPWQAATPDVAVARAETQPIARTPVQRPEGMMSVGAPAAATETTEAASVAAPPVDKAQRQQRIVAVPDPASTSKAAPRQTQLAALEVADDLRAAPLADTPAKKFKSAKSARRIVRRAPERRYYDRPRAYASAWYPRRSARRRFIAPFNMDQRLSGIY